MISIIVPIYNVEEYIRQCVDSITAQTLGDIEIILVDDGSPDSCPQICDEYAKKDSRVKVVHKENGGLMSARQAGLRAASGSYVGFVDGDDRIEPDMYERFAQAIEKYSPDIAVCEFIYSYSDKEEVSSQSFSKPFYTKEELMSDIYPSMLFANRFYHYGVMPSCWSKIYKKELLEKHLFSVDTRITIGEDAAFTYPCLLDAQSAAYVDKALYHYRINPKSMTQAYSDTVQDKILIPYNILKEYLKASCYDYSSQLDYYLIYLINGIIRNEANPNNPKSPKQTKEVLRAFVNNDDITSAARKVNLSLLPVHTKFIAKFFAKKSVFLLYIYTRLLRRFL
ncbi:MAG: glycosyltransferase [Eubacterium sp.]